MQQTRRAKFIMLAVLLIFTFFFSNDFGLIDVEKTSIITALAIDKEDDGSYIATAQIAVPEATDTNTENQKAQISGKGSTIGAAIKDFGDTSGWFPKLSFCNLIIIGNGFSDSNVIKVLDYFAKTLRVQDSALVAMSEKKASELLEIASPLDNISSFALQKILLKNTGFDRDVASTDIKTFCSGHYSDSASSYMPLIKVIPSSIGKSSDEQGNSSGSNSTETGKDTGSGGGGSGTEKDKNYLFNAKTTALFKDGKKVGELDENTTLCYNALASEFKGTTIPIDNVETSLTQKSNYLLTVMRARPSITLTANTNELILHVDLKLYCRVSDHNADGSDQALSENKPLPKPLSEKAEKFFIDNINNLIETSRQTECDILKIKEKLYRFHFKQYSRYKDNFLSVLRPEINVTVTGQK
ncbi:MAG: hypothetical protein IJB32_03895 [Clostridia bacterium]|nr:hypothetical protein [Clostridia bacterium]